MKRLTKQIFLMLCLLLAGKAQAQWISGTVTDAATGSPLPGVSVYYDGTSLGTVSNNEGKFGITALANNATPLIFSCVGFNRQSTTAYAADQPMTIKLVRKPIQLRAVTIGSDGLTDNEKQIWFKREFLGMPASIHDCTILNIDDVYLSYEKPKNMLTGTADQPVMISNPYLGYKIKYGLEVFASTSRPQRTVYQGFQFFIDDTSLPPAERKKVLERRDKAYYGSCMHFIRSLWAGRLAEEGFTVYRNSLRKVPEGEIICEENGKKYLNLGTAISIEYKGKNTLLKPKRPGIPVEIDSHGYFDPSGVVWNGTMGIQRMAGLLPFDFEPSYKR